MEPASRGREMTGRATDQRRGVGGSLGGEEALSRRMVTGPSLWISTSMCCWKRPVSTRRPVARISVTKWSKRD